MLTFFGEQALKDAVRARVAEHERLDQFQRHLLTYYDQDTNKGCFIGCAIHYTRKNLSSEGHYIRFERLLGLPAWIGQVGEFVFERSSSGYSAKFSLRLFDAIPVGADLEAIQEEVLSLLLANSMFSISVTNAERPDILRFSNAIGRLITAMSYGTHFNIEEFGDKLIALVASCKPEETTPELPSDETFQSFRAEVLKEHACREKQLV